MGSKKLYLTNIFTIKPKKVLLIARCTPLLLLSVTPHHLSKFVPQVNLPYF